jgi:hypothetical protein
VNVDAPKRCENSRSARARSSKELLCIVAFFVFDDGYQTTSLTAAG